MDKKLPQPRLKYVQTLPDHILKQIVEFEESEVLKSYREGYMNPFRDNLNGIILNRGFDKIDWETIRDELIEMHGNFIGMRMVEKMISDAKLEVQKRIQNQEIEEKLRKKNG